MNFSKLNNRSKGIIFIIMSAFGFAMMSAFVKISGDLPSFQKTFFRNIISLSVAFTIILAHKGSFFGKRENQKRLVLRSVFGILPDYLSVIGYIIIFMASLYMFIFNKN